MPIKPIGKGLAQKFKRMVDQSAKVIDAEMRSIADDMRDDFLKTVETWKNKPKFQVIKKAKSYLVVTDDEIYAYVDKGTRRHKIPVGDKGFLAFQGNYQAKTTPRVIASRPGGASGPVVFTAKDIQHPGTEARGFTKTINQKWQKQISQRMKAALKENLKAAGL